MGEGRQDVGRPLVTEEHRLVGGDPLGEKAEKSERGQYDEPHPPTGQTKELVQAPVLHVLILRWSRCR